MEANGPLTQEQEAKLNALATGQWPSDLPSEADTEARYRQLYEQAVARARQEDHTRRLERYEQRYPAADMGSYQTASLDGFVLRPGTKLALEQARKYADSLPNPEPPGLLIFGPYGNGKSHLAGAIANSARERALAVVWVQVKSWLRRLAAMEQEERDEMLRLAIRADLLVLDELGAERLTAARAGYLLEVIDERYRRRAPLVVTTNHDPDALIQVLTVPDNGLDAGIDGQRIVDRLVELCLLVQNSASSYRLELAQRRMVGGGDGG